MRRPVPTVAHARSCGLKFQLAGLRCVFCSTRHPRYEDPDAMKPRTLLLSVSSTVSLFFAPSAPALAQGGGGVTLEFGQSIRLAAGELKFGHASRNGNPGSYALWLVDPDHRSTVVETGGALTRQGCFAAFRRGRTGPGATYEGPGSAFCIRGDNSIVGVSWTLVAGARRDQPPRARVKYATWGYDRRRCWRGNDIPNDPTRQAPEWVC